MQCWKKQIMRKKLWKPGCLGFRGWRFLLCVFLHEPVFCLLGIMSEGITFHHIRSFYIRGHLSVRNGIRAGGVDSQVFFRPHHFSSRFPSNFAVNQNHHSGIRFENTSNIANKHDAAHIFRKLQQSRSRIAA